MFVLIWRYRVTAAKREQFIAAYDDKGDWARLFSEGDGFIRTELVQDPTDAEAYMTLDFWKSQGAFSRFQNERASAYRELDALCEGFTETETFVGAFEMAGPPDARAFYPVAAHE